jgi:hypothetical protein
VKHLFPERGEYNIKNRPINMPIMVSGCSNEKKSYLSLNLNKTLEITELSKKDM